MTFPAVGQEALAEAAGRLERQRPGYLDAVRRRAASLAVPDGAAARTRRAIDLTAETGHVSPNVALTSRHLAGRIIKRVVSTVTRFYILSVTGQVTEFAEASAWMGQSLLEYTASLEAEVADLRKRVRCLEEAAGTS